MERTGPTSQRTWSALTVWSAIPDHTGMTDHAGRAPTTPDYDLAESLMLSDPEQYKALFEPTRQEIVSLLLERAATTAELAQTLGKPKGTVGHHLKTLESVGLVQVVRTKQVRALTAKYYGRTARVFYYRRTEEAAAEPGATAQLIADEAARVAPGTHLPTSIVHRHVRMSTERAEEWLERLHALADEFTHQERDGETTFGFTVGIYPTDRPQLATEHEPDPELEQ